MTWWMLRDGIDVHDPAAVAAAAGKPEIVSGTDPAAPTITVDGVDVGRPIRTEEVTSTVSAGQRRPRGAGPDHRAAARRSIGDGRASSSRAATSAPWCARRRPEDLPHRRPEARAARRAARKGSDVDRHRGSAAQARRGRLRPQDLAAGQGGRRVEVDTTPSPSTRSSSASSPSSRPSRRRVTASEHLSRERRGAAVGRRASASA